MQQFSNFMYTSKVLLHALGTPPIYGRDATGMGGLPRRSGSMNFSTLALMSLVVGTSFACGAWPCCDRDTTRRCSCFVRNILSGQTVSHTPTPRPLGLQHFCASHRSPRAGRIHTVASLRCSAHPETRSFLWVLSQLWCGVVGSGSEVGRARGVFQNHSPR